MIKWRGCGMPKFKDTALYTNFKPGDLIYGIEDIRNLCRKALKEKVKTRITIDEYNNAIIPVFLDENAKFIKNYNQGKYEEKVNSLGDSELRLHLQFLQEVQHAKLNIQNDDLPTSKKNTEAEERKIRRACKAGMFKVGIKIHFLLDDVELDQVFTPGQPHYNKHTSAELRYIAKHWPELSDKVIFYHNGNVVTPEWQASSSTRCLRLVNHLPISMLRDLNFEKYAVAQAPPAAPRKEPQQSRRRGENFLLAASFQSAGLLQSAVSSDDDYCDDDESTDAFKRGPC